jgi:hypothetical protein
MSLFFPPSQPISAGWTDLGSGFLTPVEATSTAIGAILDQGVKTLTSGQDYTDITFNIAQASGNTWNFSDIEIENTVDATPDKIMPVDTTVKSGTGGRIRLSAAPATGNYKLIWRIRSVPS